MKLLMIGAGSMSEALVRGWIDSGLSPETITMTNRSDRARLDQLHNELGVQVVEDEDVNAYDIVVLAMQPDGVLPYVRSKTWHAPLLISVAAHIEPAELEAASGLPAVCAMPNTPVAFRDGMTGLWFGPETDEVVRATATALFERVGRTAVTDAKTMSAFMAAAGCSPAFFYEIVGSMTPVLTDAGFDETTARQIVAQAMKGSAELLLNETRPTDALISDVAAPGGPTDRGVGVLRDRNLSDVMSAALRESAKEDVEQHQE
ncbi:MULTISPECIES: pyrroline-5-carboxylate reductase family protein [Exiguobacterium]|uniref:pyrroline-5-carboxylate reductase family protein n=1 Tax=Exiguobacterium TaxID=33986 RepID=UPI001BE563F6|nr:MULTISPECIES: pyrroline-5-carboxylate reductase dimerization domain-containing protein [Exiguobacterium]MCT4783723.1 NAD(P)-binding domain-containing protein [Exiguobacterium himgiriensis]